MIELFVMAAEFAARVAVLVFVALFTLRFIFGVGLG